MTTSHKHETGGISLIEAVETLSSIADIDVGRDIGIPQLHDLILHDKSLRDKTIRLLQKQDGRKSIHMVKDVFKVILNYLRHFYSNDYGTINDSKTIEGIKIMMVIVGEATKKLDKYTQLFRNTKAKSITELKEYRQLQEFYLSRIARKIDEGTLSRWMLALTQRAWEEQPTVELKGKIKESLPTKHVFVDLETVKRDTEYELFFLRKEDGSRFFSPRLIRNIKLVCDFGDYFGMKKEADPLEDIQFWQDSGYQVAAKNILGALGNRVDRFYREAMRFKDRELVEHLNKCLMALYLCANPRNQLKNTPQKSCMDYFTDFQTYLRSALNSHDYHKLITYTPKASNKLSHLLLEVVHGLCMALFYAGLPIQECQQHMLKLINHAKEEQSPEHEKAAQASHQLWNRLGCDYAAVNKLMKHHAHGPLVKVLQVLQEGGRFAFDPLSQRNIPNPTYALQFQDEKIVNMRMPCPTTQEFVHKAGVVEEFKAFIRACIKDEFINKLLIINFQDRTSWREHVRCSALEELQDVPEFSKHLTVVTLTKDTEFYHQLASYQRDNHADVFMDQLKQHLSDAGSGFYFPDYLHKKLFPAFVDGVIAGIHRVFFNDRNILLHEHRLNFIEIFYLFLELKLIELVKPDAFSLMCKDGIDVGSSASAELYAFLKLINTGGIQESDKDALNTLLHGPAVLLRERVILPERFNRLVDVLKCIESVRDQVGDKAFATKIHDTFGDYFKSPVLSSKALLC